jgi:hypothetical protein
MKRLSHNLSALACVAALALCAGPVAGAPVALTSNWDQQCNQQQYNQLVVIRASEAPSALHPTEVSLPDTTQPQIATQTRSYSGSVSPSDALRATEQTLIPLPAAEWSGLAGLAGLALVRARKAFRKMFL